MNLDLINQLILPVCLALLMFSMGLSLSLASFQTVLKTPLPVLVGVCLQLIALPIIAWLIIISTQFFFSLNYLIAASLLIIAACPGGATSNIISHLSGGNGALSICMTAIVSLLIPFILPISLSFQLELVSTSVVIDLPLFKTWMQLLIVTVIPVVVAMYVRLRYLNWALKHETWISKAAALLFFSLVCFLFYQQWPQLQQQGWQVFYVCALLCLSALLMSYVVAKVFKFDLCITKTLAIETSIQNAGTGMFIAIVILKQPELALLPLSYGLLMNIPAFIFIAQNHMAHKK